MPVAEARAAAGGAETGAEAGPDAPDALVIGAGSAGLAATLALARAGLATLCVDPAPPGASPADAAGAPPEARSIALLPASVAFLCDIGAWSSLAAAATPIREFRFHEQGAGGAPLRFCAEEAGVEALAWNVPGAALRAALAAGLGPARDKGGRVRRGQLAGLVCREDRVLARLADGGRLTARLLVAADGGASASRRAAGIPVRQWRSGRRSIAFAGPGRGAAAGICREYHGSGQTAALVPLAGGRVAVVWVLPGARAAALLAAGRAALAAAFARFLGDAEAGLDIDTGPESWPETFLVARQLVGRRLVLAGEAAHVLSPVGAQGLNLSLADAASLGCLARTATAAGLDPGGPALLAAHARRRRADIALRTGLVAAYAGASSLPGPLPARLRQGVAASLTRLPPLRRRLLAAALAGGMPTEATP